jgi:hypothetical protein
MPQRSKLAETVSNRAESDTPKKGQVQKELVDKIKSKTTTVIDKGILYPKLEVTICVGKHAVTSDQAKKLLGWETEDEYKERTGDKGARFDEITLTDVEGNRVRCWNNSHNRPFSDTWAYRLAQTVLNRQWAGPITMPGETINGETIVIGNRGAVESGQHRLIGLVLSKQMWGSDKQKEHWQTLWKTEPVLETIIVYGVSESARVLQTLDNVKPRSLSDVIYTSELFTDMTSVERKEGSRMLAAAIDLLWKRTEASSNHEKYQTHSTSIGFFGRHKKLLEAVKDIFKLNEDRSLSALKLSPGMCAGALYFMASSVSDVDTYRNEDPAPSEASLTFDRWEQAKELFGDIAADATKVKPLRYAIGSLVDEDAGGGGRTVEKLGLLAKAWVATLAGGEMTAEDVQLEYAKDEDDVNHLINCPGFGGIDLGPSLDTEKSIPPDPSEIEKQKEVERSRAKKPFANNSDRKPPTPKKVRI